MLVWCYKIKPMF